MCGFRTMLTIIDRSSKLIDGQATTNQEVVQINWKLGFGIIFSYVQIISNVGMNLK